MNTQLSPAQEAYRDRLAAIEAEKLAALSTPGANVERLNLAMLRKMSAALVKLRTAQFEESQR
jgi:hypothetical protein